ncbi:MAG: glycosyltransferase [Candidatus Hinthialibacter antarcticus]|nr:glycosyltransferase [Candidatus Hinthialibacter antarcticus]
MNSSWIRHTQFSPEIYHENQSALTGRLSPLPVNDIGDAALWLRMSPDHLVEAAIEADGIFDVQLEAETIEKQRRIQEQEINRFSAIETSNVIFVLGSDLGYSLELLSSYLSQAPRKAAVIVEPDLRQLHLALAACSLLPWINSNRIDWAVGGDWADQVRTLIWEHNYFACDQPDILFSLTARRPDRTSAWAELQALIRQCASDGKARFKQMMTGAEVYYAKKDRSQLQHLLAPSTANDPAKAVPYIQERFLDECRRNQMEVVYHEPGFRSDIRLLKQIAELRPDAMMMINRSPAEFARREQLDHLRLPRFIWCIDDPNCFVDDAFGEHDFVFTWDNAYADDLRAKNAQSVDFFPYVADMDHATAQYDECFASPVSYIGQVKCLNADELHLKPSEAALAEKAGRCKAQQRDRSYQSLLLQFQSEFGLRVIDDERDDAPRLLRYAMYIVANAHWRIAVLERARPFGLKIYGNDDWKFYLENHPLLDCFCGPADPERDVPNIFYSSKINLNIHSLQALTSLNQRDYNCPLVGGFILTDWIDGGDSFFEPDIEMAFYHDLNELQSKISHFLNHDEERQAIIEKGRARVMREHLYSVRVPRAIGTFQQRIQERYGVTADE